MAYRGPDYFGNLMIRIQQMFPELSIKAARFVGNKISNEIRRGHFDCYNVEVGRERLTGQGYFRHSEVDVCGITVHVRYTVD